MRSALPYPGSSSTLSGGFGESARMPTDTFVRAPKVEGEINANRNPREHLHEGVLVRDPSRMVKIFKCAETERSRSSMMDVEDEHNHMRAAFGLRDRFGKPGTPAAE